MHGCSQAINLFNLPNKYFLQGKMCWIEVDEK